MITGANAGIGKETARQLALKKTTEKIYLACRNEGKAEIAKKDLEEKTGRSIFEIVIIDVSKPESVKNAVRNLNDPVDALIMNAGGMGGKNPEKLTPDGVTALTATNLLGHVVLVDELIMADKLKNVALFASSEAARGVKKMGMKQPDFGTSSTDEFARVFDGSAFGKDFDAMQVYGMIKYGGTLWMSHMARTNSAIKFISVSPGGTRGTEVMNDLPFFKRIMFKYIGMPILMPLMGMSHKLSTGAKRFVDGISNEKFISGKFYASKTNKLTGALVDQNEIFSNLSNENYQDNASDAIHRFIRG